ncbi:hypothetical protein [Pseudoalteromonas sp. Of7M-16]|uniref:hypothetical protein n=1 Tax=Pseudoalteromonas sp. Of7M-16 TaxID=2917756 RepID=UPI001EF562FA|nr:hypothetical protein [Pseudoalteromonas sp. Of7M-16]MCG7548228.1 hypothetical protein [Pseudoalteromonas sp. Of7M-16]
MRKCKLNIDTLIKGHTVFVESDWFNGGESAVIDMTLNLKSEHVNVITLPIQIKNLHKLGITYLLEQEQARVGCCLAGYDFKHRAVHETDLISLCIPGLTSQYKTISVNEPDEFTVLVTMTADILAKIPGFDITSVVFMGSVPQRMTLKQWANKQPKIMFDETNKFHEDGSYRNSVIDNWVNSTRHVDLTNLNHLGNYTEWLMHDLLPKLDDTHIDLLSTALQVEIKNREVERHA